MFTYDRTLAIPICLDISTLSTLLSNISSVDESLGILLADMPATRTSRDSAPLTVTEAAGLSAEEAIAIAKAQTALYLATPYRYFVPPSSRGLGHLPLS